MFYIIIFLLYSLMIKYVFISLYNPDQNVILYSNPLPAIRVSSDRKLFYVQNR